MTVEGDVMSFLGIQFDQCSNSEIQLNQQGLIDWVLKATDMQECNPDKMPGSQ